MGNITQHIQERLAGSAFDALATSQLLEIVDQLEARIRHLDLVAQTVELQLRTVGSKFADIDRLDGIVDLLQAKIDNATATGDVLPERVGRLEGEVMRINDALNLTVESVQNTDSTISKLTEILGASDHNFTLLKKIDALFGPLIEANGNAPLDGQVVPTKAWVDEQVTRIAKKLREDVDAIRTSVKTQLDDLTGRWTPKWSQAYDLAAALYRGAIGKFDPERDNEASTQATEIARRLSILWNHEAERIAAEKATAAARGGYYSRLESFIYAITGRRS
jgi:hypothetical protein